MSHRRACAGERKRCRSRCASAGSANSAPYSTRRGANCDCDQRIGCSGSRSVRHPSRLPFHSSSRVIARRNKLLGHWAAGLMKLSPVEAEAYAKDVVRADFEEAGDEDVIRKLLGDLVSAGVDVNEADVRAAMNAKQVEARRALIGEL